MGIIEAVYNIVNKRKSDEEKETVQWNDNIRNELGSDDVGNNTRRREGEVGDKLSSGEALELLSGHWEHCIAVEKAIGKNTGPGDADGSPTRLFRPGPSSPSFNVELMKLSCTFQCTTAVSSHISPSLIWRRPSRCRMHESSGLRIWRR
jgi:hypothetical protein